THSQVQSQAGAVGSLWGNPWFGRRDLIPPTGDPRTSLIDRGMVGQGLITPEELAEIHKVGEEMDRVRPHVALADHAARQAADVAQAMGITIGRLRWLAFHAEAATRIHYITFVVPKKSGGERRLAAPHRQLRHCQEWILREILAKAPVHECAQGFVPGRSTV